MQCPLFLAPLLLISSTALAQDFNLQRSFEAIIDERGNVELIPTPATEGGGGDLAPMPAPGVEQTEVDRAPSPADAMFEGDMVRALYIAKDAGGAVTGIFTSQAAALANHTLEPGDTLEVFRTSTDLVVAAATAVPDDNSLRKVALDAAKQLMAMVRETACDFDPLPDTVSPSVQVSFGFFAGASITVQGTWKVETICNGNK